MARLRSEAVALGAFPVLTRDLSSWQVTSRTWWSLSSEGLDAASPGPGRPAKSLVLVIRVIEAEDGQEQAGIVLDAAYDGGDSAVSGLADEPDIKVTECGHDAGRGACPDL